MVNCRVEFGEIGLAVVPIAPIEENVKDSFVRAEFELGDHALDPNSLGRNNAVIGLSWEVFGVSASYF